MDLAGTVDMTASISVYQAGCNDPVITSMLGGTPSEVPEHYAQASAIKLVPLGIPPSASVGVARRFLAATARRRVRRRGDAGR